MPTGKTHAIVTAISAGIAAPLLYTAGQPAAAALAFVGGCMLGIIVTPDLDSRYRDTHSETIVRRSAGRLVGMLWDMLWLPYAQLIPRHRHPLSHWPILGTVLRLIYLLAAPLLIWWLLGQGFALPALWPLPTAAWWALGGLAFVDSLHAFMDWVFT